MPPKKKSPAEDDVVQEINKGFIEDFEEFKKLSTQMEAIDNTRKECIARMVKRKNEYSKLTGKVIKIPGEVEGVMDPVVEEVPKGKKKSKSKTSKKGKKKEPKEILLV